MSDDFEYDEEKSLAKMDADFDWEMAQIKAELEDREFIRTLLFKFGKEVSESTRQLLNFEVSEQAYIDEARRQVREYQEILLAWKMLKK